MASVGSGSGDDDRGARVPDEDQDERAAVRAAQDLAATKQSDADRIEAARIVREHRETRLYKEAIQGQSIAQSSQDGQSAADWVNKLRTEGPATPAPFTKKKLVPQLRESVPDLRIRHDLEEFTEGESVILTLKDQRIGDEDENDELENLQLVEQKKVERNLNRKAKRTKIGNDELDTESPKVLEKYDEVKDELDARKGGMLLTSTGSVIDQAARIRAKLAAPSAANKLKYDFGLSSGPQVSSDFYSKEEVSVFKNLRSKKRKNKTKSAPRTIVVEDFDLPSGTSADHGSRETAKTSIKARIEANVADMKAKRQKFDSAVVKADSRSHTLVDSTPFLFEDDAEDIQLQEALVKANRAALRSQETDQPIVSAVRQPTTKFSAMSANQAQDEGLVFSSASEFMINVRANAEERAKQPIGVTIKQESNVGAPVSQAALEESSDEDAMDVDDTNNAVTIKKEAGDEYQDSSAEEELAFMADVSNVDKGVSGALKLIRSRGLINSKSMPPLMAGRARDGRIDEHKDTAPHMRLDRVDEFGRPMTQKEAFRELSYRFHGHRPGAKKREKVLKELQQQLKQQESISGRVVTRTQKLADVTAQTGRHYVVMDSKSGAFGGVATQKLSIDVDTVDPQLQLEDDSRAYVAGSKKVEFAISKAE